jgi:hypothetical protein
MHYRKILVLQEEAKQDNDCRKWVPCDAFYANALLSQNPRFAEEEAGQRLQEMVPSMPMPYALPPPVGMQMGGDPMMEAMQQQAPVDQGVASMMPPEAMPAAPGPSAGDINEASVTQMLTDVAPNFADPEEAEDFETMMNSVRGDEASVEQRRMELASLVGEEDAMKTPESVLALVQPIVQMSLVDQGIGGLAEQEMQEPVEGAMAGGIMSMMGG